MKGLKQFFAIMFTAAIISVTIFTAILYFSDDSIEKKHTTVDVSYTTLPEPVSISESDDNIPPENVELSLSSLPKIYTFLPMEHISQLPELPTGCEITSLTTVLNYLGYDVEKEYMADNYLEKLSDLSGNFYDYFIGSPYNSNSWGCFAPAITNAANNFLEDKASELKAYNISNSSIRSLFSELCDDNPVIVWTSSTFDQKVTYSDISLNDGTVFRWPNKEHCVVLIGYNLDRHTVTLSDPLKGIVERDMTQFINRYREVYKQAVVIK